MLKTATAFKQQQSGFTLVEIAVVLVIIGILVGSFIGTFADRIETTRRENTREQLEDIRSAILGFASAWGRLPCPATTTSSGLEQPFGGGPCASPHGFVPGRTLGINGAYNRDNLLIDSWGNPIRYSVTTSATGVSVPNAFTTSGVGGIKDSGMDVLVPDLVVCDGDSTSGTTCAGGPTTLIDSAPFILLSLGKDGSEFVEVVAPNSDQGENAGEFAVAKNAGGEDLRYTVGNNRVFVSKAYSSVDAAAGQFDDIIIWESRYIIYSRMLEAGQLP